MCTDITGGHIKVKFEHNIVRSHIYKLNCSNHFTKHMCNHNPIFACISTKLVNLFTNTCILCMSRGLKQ